MDFKQIIKAWRISYNPTPDQVKLAHTRGRICDECDSKIMPLNIPLCKECGCPIGKKIFTDEFNPCPLNKWKDSDFIQFSERKHTKTII